MKIPEDCKNWLSYELKQDSNNNRTYYLALSSTLNELVENRTCDIVISNQSISKTLSVTQNGGIIFKTNITDESTGEEVKSFSPQGGNYVLDISSNTKWTYSIQISTLGTQTSDDINVSETSFNGLIGKLNVSTTAIEADSSGRTLTLNIKFDNGEEKSILIYQNNWNIMLFVNYGESLSSEISKIQDKINNGYKVTNLYIDNGKLDCKAPSSVIDVDIKNVENIPEDFCYGNNLKELSLSNVKRIGARAFAKCGLNRITIPASVTYIGDGAFLDSKITYPFVTCYNPTPPTLGYDVFHKGVGEGSLRVPMGSKPEYEAIQSWRKQFSGITEF